MYDEAEEEQERGIIRPLIKEDEDEDAEEYGVEGLRCENGELLLARDDEAIEWNRTCHESNQLKNA